ncbi:MAG TPA: twin-arginine translocase TatA/TatE family subunit [Terriglobales bacterium]|jgi:sec-independent protein translocase protein TatB|nr:twin-arginine translocase TatA/TatE family subunit [Terriglobales bacterium]
MPDILFILLLALVIFGPKRLPEIARQLAKFMVQFRMMRDDLKRQLNAELLKIDLEEKQKAAALPPRPVQTEPQPVPTDQLAENSPTG